MKWSELIYGFFFCFSITIIHWFLEGEVDEKKIRVILQKDKAGRSSGQWLNSVLVHESFSVTIHISLHYKLFEWWQTAQRSLLIKFSVHFRARPFYFNALQLILNLENGNKKREWQILNHYFHGGGVAWNLWRANLQPLSQKGICCMELDKTRTKRIWIWKNAYGIKIFNPFMRISVRKMKCRRPVEFINYSYGRQASYLANFFTKSNNNNS